MSMSASYKPSPLSYGSPRASPFRRPESPHSPSPLRQSTPNPSPTKTMAATSTTPSQLAKQSTPGTDAITWTPRGLVSIAQEQERSSTSKSNASPGLDGMVTHWRPGLGSNNSLGKLQTAQVRELREGFQILDGDSDGHVGRDDVADMLTQLGMPANPSDLTAFFPPSTPQTVTLPVYLNSLASLLASLSPSSELLSAFSAFDEDDSGQIDLGELRDALLHTAPEPGVQALSEKDIEKVMNGFTGRKTLGKQTVGGMAKRGEVFKYQDFLSSIQGGASLEKNENE